MSVTFESTIPTVTVRAVRSPNAPAHAPDTANWASEGRILSHGDEVTIRTDDAERLVKAGKAEYVA